MDDTTRLERAVIKWLSDRGYRVAAIAPVAVFFAVLVPGIAVASAASGRSPFDPYVVWIICAAVFAALALYLTSFYALGSVLEGARRFKLLKLHQTIREIRDMNWRDFEDLVAAYLQEQGFDVEHQGRDVADGGVDLVARKHETSWLVQCKHYRDDWVGERPVRELLGLVQHRKADGGFLVSSGGFDQAARKFVKRSTEIRLVGGDELRSLVEQTVRGRATKEEAATPPAR